MATNPAPTYTILGGDGQQYGPVTAEQFRAWVRDGRANGQTQVLPEGGSAWVAAASLPELGVSAPVSTPPSPAAPLPTPGFDDPALDQRIRSGASWFYWVAALSLINSILRMSKSGIEFAIGLGFTHRTDVAFYNTPVVALAISVICSGVIALLGWFAIKRHAWAFIVGLIALVLDTGLCVLMELWISTAFHAWAIASIFMAFRASRAARGN